MKEKDCRIYLADILQSADQISKFIAGMDLEKFSADEKTVWAVIRGLEIIGEAARNVLPELRNKYPQIPWRLMIGMRDRLIHDYGRVNLGIVWQTATENVPAAVPQIRQMLNELGG